jgi:hypothetical protein
LSLATKFQTPKQAPGLALAFAEIGGDGCRQRQIGAERETGSDADGGEGNQVATAEQTRPGERENGKGDGGEPGVNTTVARCRFDPERQGSSPGDEVKGEQRAAGFFELQDVGDEKEEKRRRQGRGDAVGDEDAKQAAEGDVGEDSAQTGQQTRGA